MIRLLDKWERTRLGSRSGASEVKQHKWFAKINWGLLRNTRPPVSRSILLSRELREIEGVYNNRRSRGLIGYEFFVDRSGSFECAGSGELAASERVKVAAPGGGGKVLRRG